MARDTGHTSSWPGLRAGPLITGAALVGAGSLIAIAGLGVGGSHLLSVARRWIRGMEPSPAELASKKWVQAKRAAAAGTTAWQNGVAAHEQTVSL